MIESERLILRPWQDRDLPAYAELNADPRVMAFFPAVLTADETAAQIRKMNAARDRDGYCFAAVERRDDGAFLGMAGLSRVSFPSPCEGQTEIGWRLAYAHWGRGYATEAALAWLRHGFAALNCAEIVAFAVPANQRSIAVMGRLGMQPDPARDFDHPRLPKGHALRRHRVFARQRQDTDP